MRRSQPRRNDQIKRGADGLGSRKSDSLRAGVPKSDHTFSVGRVIASDELDRIADAIWSEESGRIALNLLRLGVSSADEIDLS